MKSFQFKSLLLLAALVISLPSFGQGLKAFKLKNGLSIYIWEDESKSDVFGLVGVRAGSINDPEEYTGLAHYLEHVMFRRAELDGRRTDLQGNHRQVRPDGRRIRSGKKGNHQQGNQRADRQSRKIGASQRILQPDGKHGCQRSECRNLL